MFYIKTPVNTALDIQVLDVSGRVVYKSQEKPQNGIVKIDSRLTKGNYVVKITAQGTVKSEKLMVK